MKNSKKHSKSKCETLSGDHQLSLKGFRPVYAPDTMPLKFVYSDYRVLTAVANQASYVYRLNSLFDPDQTGVGGQPDGFDLWKTIYGTYRVVAAKVEVQAVGNGANANGFLTIAPTDGTTYASAEEVAGLRRARATTFSQTQTGVLKASYHISQLLGRSDESVLADPYLWAAVSASPSTQYYLTVAIETGNSATGQSMVWTKITYYARMEQPIAVLDSTRVHRARFNAGIFPSLQPPKFESSALSSTALCLAVKQSDFDIRGDSMTTADSPPSTVNTVVSSTPCGNSQSNPAQCQCWRK